MDVSADDSGGMSRAVGGVWPVGVAVEQGFGEDSSVSGAVLAEWEVLFCRMPTRRL